MYVFLFGFVLGKVTKESGKAAVGRVVERRRGEQTEIRGRNNHSGVEEKPRG